MHRKTLDQKLDRIRNDPSCRDFILADAKDADMAYGIAAPGKSPEHHANEASFRTLDEYRQIIRSVVDQGLVDIVLMSVSTSDLLTMRQRIFDQTAITPAIRANDTSDIWLAGRVDSYTSRPALPFRSASLDQAMCGHENCGDSERNLGVDLGLYSMTLNNDLHLDHAMLMAYAQFRADAEQKGFRHFLEVFEPNACDDHCPSDVPRFVNDSIVRTLAGVGSSSRPIFLKIPYFGPAAMEALARYDSSLVVGILGGSSGTSMDAFHMLWEAKKYGARAGLFGRKINNSEHQLTFIQYLRRIADDQILPEEAVRSYHADLSKLGIRSYRRLEDDLQQTYNVTGYAGQSNRNEPSRRATASQPSHEQDPDFKKMTPAEKAQWNLERWRRILG